MFFHYKLIPLLSIALLLVNNKSTYAIQQQQSSSVETISSNCDCGYTDPTLNQNWNEMWYMDFSSITQANTNNNSMRQQQSLYNRKDLFFSNYAIPAKYNDSYARVFRKENVVINDNSLQVGITIDAQKKIWCGGMGTTRQDFLYGSFRSYIKTSGVPGTVAGMFVFHPQGEIDIELLASVKPSQAYFAMHPGITDSKGNASPLTHGNYVFGFDPSINYHEYRIDWLPSLAVFYIDGVEAYKMTTNVLSQPGRIMFNHWTDGNPRFSQGPVQQDAFLLIKNMTFFFNSSTPILNTPKCINDNSTCNIEKIITSLKDGNTVSDGSYFSNNKTSSKPTVYTTLPSSSQPTNDLSAKSASLSLYNLQTIQALVYLFFTFTVAYYLL